MLAINGIYDGENIKPIDDIPFKKKARVIITFIEEIVDEETEIRNMVAEPNGFDFWRNEKEDLYQDYLKEKI